MKQRNIEIAMLLVAVAFIAFCLGLFIGKRHEPDVVTITTELALPQTDAPASQPASEESGESEPPTESAAAYISGRLNINTATAQELATLPGIGEKLAQRIVAYRESNGPFSSVEELCSVSGIGEKRLDAIREYITVG